MICLDKFSWTRFRHHCRACGYLVCSSCSPFLVQLPSFEEESGSRVCVQCFGLKQPTANIVEVRSPLAAALNAAARSPLDSNSILSSKGSGTVRRADNLPNASIPPVRPSRKAIISSDC